MQVLRINSHDMRPSGEAQRPSPICADRRNVGPGFSRRGVFAVHVLVALPVPLRWLQPWKLFSMTAIDETLPPGAQTVWLGQFDSRIHRTSGTVRLVTLLDGEQILRIENLHTTQGPQLRVWLSDARRAPAHCGADGSSVPRARRPGGRCPSEEYGIDFAMLNRGLHINPSNHGSNKQR
jgi:Electron transfer DM13